MGRLLQRKLQTFGPTQSSERGLDLNHDNQITTELSAALEERQELRKPSWSSTAGLLFQGAFQAGTALLLLRLAQGMGP